MLERADTLEVHERVLHDGSVHAPFGEPGARRGAEAIRDRGYAAVEVAFLHAHAKDAQEKAMRAILADVDPSIHVSLSSDLSRECREYKRTSTAVLDAYITPIVHEPCASGTGGWRNAIRWGSDDGHDGSRATGQPDPLRPCRPRDPEPRRC